MLEAGAFPYGDKLLNLINKEQEDMQQAQQMQMQAGMPASGEEAQYGQA